MTQQALVSLLIARPSDDPQSRAQLALQAAKDRVLSTAEDYQACASELIAVKARWAELEAVRKDTVRPIDEARKKVQDLFNPPLSLLATAEQVLKAKLVDYSREQERQRQEEQLRVEAEAKRERERLQREAADAERKARETAEAARREAEELRRAGDADKAAKLERRADAAEARAAEKADRLEHAAATVVAPVIQREAPKVAGVSSREKWCFVVEDPTKVPLEYRTIDESKIGKVVAALKAETMIPGVRVYRDTILAAGRK